MLERLRRGGITRLAIIAVNAAVEARQDWARIEKTPGMLSVVAALSNSSINRTTKETVALVEDNLALWQANRAAHRVGADDEPKIYFIRVDFHASQDPAERAFFDSVPTSLSLPAETTDRLVHAGERLLRESPAYQSLLHDLAVERAACTAPPPPAKAP